MLRLKQCVLFIVFIAPPTSVVGGEAVQLRILSWNIHHGEGTDGRLDLDRIAAVIKSVQPDMVALQEVDKGCDRTQKANQPGLLAELTGLHAVFEKNIKLGDGEYGNAVLSRWPIVSHRNEALPCLGNGEQRGALLAEVIMKPENSDTAIPLTFISTHLDHRKPDAERLASAERINLLALKSTGRIILAGDLNAPPTSAVLQRFFEYWENSSIESLPTIPADKPRSQIDFILLSPAVKGKVIECRVLDEQVASDHRAIFSVIELAP